MIVLDVLLRRKMVFNQCGVNSLDLVGTDGGADTASTDCHAAIHRPRCDRPGQWNDEVQVIVIRPRLARAEIHYLVTGLAKSGSQFLLQFKPAVIGGDSNTHEFPSAWIDFPRRCAIGQNRSLMLANATRRNGRVATL